MVRVLLAAVVCWLGVSVQTTAFGQGAETRNSVQTVDQSKKKPPKDKKVKKTSKRKNEKKSAPIYSSYDYEFFGSLQFEQHSGALNKALDETPEEFAQSKLNSKLGIGFLFGDQVEPFIEYSMYTESRTIGNYTASSSVGIWGAGLILNVPLGDSPSSEVVTSYNTPVFSNSTWIPYAGFMFVGKTLADTAGADTQSTVAEVVTQSLLIAGIRYMLYDHLALNMWLRMAMESDVTEADSGEKSGGAITKTTLELNLISFSLLF